jgi:hypothetical protein
MGLCIMTALGYKKTTSEEFERATTFGDYPGWAKRDAPDRTGEVADMVSPTRVGRPSGP